MKQKTIFILFGLIFNLSVFSQSDMSIETKKVFGGYKFEQNGKSLKVDQMLFIMQDTPDAFRYIQKAKSSTTFANIFGAGGGFCIGWTLGTLIGGGEMNWAILGVGAGCLGIMIPFANSANKNALNAVDKYNNRNTSALTTFDIQFGFVNNGLGIAIRF